MELGWSWELGGSVGGAVWSSGHRVSSRRPRGAEWVFGSSGAPWDSVVQGPVGAPGDPGELRGTVRAQK